MKRQSALTTRQPLAARLGNQHAPEITARFRNPAGNVIGLYQEPDGQGASEAT